MNGVRNLPIGIQNFEKLRKNDFVYVDKTEYIYKLVHSKIPFFLSRPGDLGKACYFQLSRRIGKVKRNCL